MSNTTIWHKTIDSDGIVWLALDVRGSKTNTLTSDVLLAFSKELDVLAETPPTGLVIRSAKKNGFIAGADINTFADQHSVDDTFYAITQVQNLFTRLENLACPTVALIHGFCLGGGLELSLACDYRLAEDDPKTRIGLPEVKLGIHPGYGGSVRLIELIGVIPAMNTMLTGRTLSARAAQKMAIIDRIAPARQLEIIARDLIITSPATKQAPTLQQVLSFKPLRPLIAALIRKQTRKQANPTYYPAPFALIECWQHQPSNRQDYFTSEALSVANLIHTDTAQNLIRLFFLQDRLKTFGKQSDFKAQHVHVVGAGVMGGDIATWCALRGLNVTLQDYSYDRIAPAIKRAHVLFKQRLKIPHLIQAAMDRLVPDITGSGVAKADVVIEAIFENLDAKHDLFKIIEPQLQENALLATNTSSIPLEQLAACLTQPKRLVGLHFFNPVAKMQLVEIVSSKTTLKKWQKQAAAFAHQIGRLPLPVKSSPGFLVNRILMPYLLEAVQMESEGIPILVIDKAATDFGMPMGPIELADTVGLDICHSVATMLAPSLGIDIPESLARYISQNHLGRKTGQGFYRYDSDNKRITTSLLTDYADTETVRQRLILRLINECVACLDEGIVEDSDLLDAGMVFGTGFAPFRGGPMHYLHQHGSDVLQKQLEQLTTTIGTQFKPHRGWERLS
ncbi:MAG: 3-hydroxyacyl-CoA dehydrogenase NAD-binding domain-containing protein [Gammaproteobacteria bacterium]|nr:3-hydroxyacyl-CoA dehydrogenase NAD-binding domain-containing protein [Gammaproteobacteria bacterium]